MDELLEQPFRAVTSLAAYRQVYEELDGEVICLDFDNEDESTRPRTSHTRSGPALPGHIQLA